MFRYLLVLIASVSLIACSSSNDGGVAYQHQYSGNFDDQQPFSPVRGIVNFKIKWNETGTAVSGIYSDDSLTDGTNVIFTGTISSGVRTFEFSLAEPLNGITRIVMVTNSTLGATLNFNIEGFDANGNSLVTTTGTADPEQTTPTLSDCTGTVAPPSNLSSGSLVMTRSHGEIDTHLFSNSTTGTSSLTGEAAIAATHVYTAAATSATLAHTWASLDGTQTAKLCFTSATAGVFVMTRTFAETAPGADNGFEFDDSGTFVLTLP